MEHLENSLVLNRSTGIDRNADVDNISRTVINCAGAPIAKILLYGDIHLNSKNYGAHKDYKNESLEMFRNITKTAEEHGVTHIIGLGDFTYGRFHTLEYRDAVEKELERQLEITNGNRWEIKGNHDTATYGMTEYEYYLKKGMFKPAENIQIGNLNLSMVNYGEHRKTNIIAPEKNKMNVVVMHNFFKFEQTLMANYGSAYILDNFEPWFGVDYIFGGHIHKMAVTEGSIEKDGQSHNCSVMYLGCPCRPSYREGHMDEKGYYIIISVYQTMSDSDKDNGVVIEVIDFELPSITDTFTLEEKKQEAERLAQKRVDISDIVQKLDSHTKVVGEPEDKIMAMTNIDIEYRLKAIQLLKNGQA